MNSLDWHELKNTIQGWASRPLMAILVLLVMSVWGLTWLGISTQTAVVGQRLRDLEDQLLRVTQENAQLEYHIAVMTQPARVAARATTLKLRPAAPNQVVYLYIPFEPPTEPVDRDRVDPESAFDPVAWLRDALSWLRQSARPGVVEASR